MTMNDNDDNDNESSPRWAACGHPWLQPFIHEFKQDGTFAKLLKKMNRKRWNLREVISRNCPRVTLMTMTNSNDKRFNRRYQYVVAVHMNTITTGFFAHENITALLSGATAGLCVDMTLYPLDTIKTRLQSATPSGQLRLFAGLPAVLFGSAPAAALFFCAYEMSRNMTYSLGAPIWASSMVAACVGEIVACTVRVPCETVKQRAQNRPILGAAHILSETIRVEGVRGMYRGYLSTIFRELPFSVIQFPVWEALKKFMEARNQGNVILHPGHDVLISSLTKSQFALCGALAGAFAGACTTPLDVVKTRIMLAEPGSILSSGNVFTALKLVHSESGIRGLYAGLGPRVGLLSIGGAIFLGLYDISRQMWSRAFHNL